MIIRFDIYTKNLSALQKAIEVATEVSMDFSLTYTNEEDSYSSKCYNLMGSCDHRTGSELLDMLSGPEWSEDTEEL